VMLISGRRHRANVVLAAWLLGFRRNPVLD
jgi:hypothetical protein